ncbi:MAG: hypothetical protein ACOYL9_07480 [Ilumatobacteraceae bacterium]
MTLGELLQLVTGRLDDIGIAYMVSGSAASSVYGEPRTTRDIDIVVAVDTDSLTALFDSFATDDVYVDRPATKSVEVEPGAMFNVIDLLDGWKVDLVVRKDRPFSRAEFDRRSMVDVLGCRVTIASAEDVLLAKLEWSKAGASSRQFDDAVGIVRVQRDQLDMAYLHRWATELGVADLLEEVLARGK